jgi:DNA-3-methyladenine glycosylase
MYGRPGYLYVYFTYGNHYMLNIVTEREGYPAAVLLRGLEPIFGLKQMIKNRQAQKYTEIASGPGKLARALGITTDHKGLDLVGRRMYLLDDGTRYDSIYQSIRVGIGNNGNDKLWRFYVGDNKHVSRGEKVVRESAIPYHPGRR